MKETKGEEWFKKLLNDEFNGWPILNSGFADAQDPVDKLVSLRLRGVQPLVTLSVASNPKIPNRYSISVEQPGWLFSQSYYNDSRFMEAYKTYLTRIVELMGAPVSNPDYKTEIELMISLEKSLAQVNPQ